jgi:hypothetical protein
VNEIDLTEGVPLNLFLRRGDRVVTTDAVHGIVEGHKHGRVLIRVGVLDGREIRLWHPATSLTFEGHGQPFGPAPPPEAS